MVSIEFNKIWSSYFNKKHATLVENGKTAILKALTLLSSKHVALPTYTCHRVLQACLDAGVTPYIVDCGLDLQIDVTKIPIEVDTVIVPHMFGIQANIKALRHLKVIEDCSQCIGLPDLGKYSDIVIASTGPTKWLNAGKDKEFGGGIIAHNIPISLGVMYNEQIANKLNQMYFEIPKMLESRTNKASELINAGIDLIGKDQPNSWLRALYFGSQKRVPYTPLHDLYPGFKCPIVNSYKNKLDWISIFN
jgi:hypothetical protein|tara:strand:- start:2083 stop:2829 length:747 start_codon:yes stop_codon:yes gene_type:complete